MARYVKRGKTWQYEISNGAQGKIRKGGFRTKNEAVAVASEIESKLKKGFYYSAKDGLLADYFLDWIEIYKKDKTSDATYFKYLNTHKNIQKYFSDCTLKSLNRISYQSYLNEFAKTHADTTVRQTNQHIRSSISLLIDEGVIQSDFTKGAIVKGKKPTQSESDKFLEFEEFQKLLVKIKEDIKPSESSSFMIYVASMTGMRFSELAGLTWDNVDFKNKIIHVKRTWKLSQLTNKYSFGETKNLQSIRDIPVDDETIQIMKNYKLEQAKFIAKTKMQPLYPFCFFSPLGAISGGSGTITNNSANKKLRRICQKLDIPKITMHGLRHTHASGDIIQILVTLVIIEVLDINFIKCAKFVPRYFFYFSYPSLIPIQLLYHKI